MANGDCGEARREGEPHGVVRRRDTEQRWECAGAFAQDAEADAAPEAAAAEAAAVAPPPKPAPKATSLADLLKRVKAGWSGERKENSEREARFKQARDDQQRLLSEAKATKAAEEARSEILESQFEANEIALTTLEDTLTERLGALGELFGVVRQAAGDTRSQVEASLVSAQIPDRHVFLEELGKNKSLPSIESLEKLWFPRTYPDRACGARGTGHSNHAASDELPG